MNKITFENLPGTNTPVNATKLNQMQSNIETAINEVEENNVFIKGKYTYETGVPSKTPTTVRIPITGITKDYKPFASVLGKGDYGDWVGVTRVYIDPGYLNVTLFNNGSGTTTRETIISYIIFK